MFVLTPGCVPAGGADALPGSPAAGSGQVSVYIAYSILSSLLFFLSKFFKNAGVTICTHK